MRKRALGKGLEALIPIQEKEVFHEGYRMIRIEDIKPNPYQPRAKIEEAEIEDLIASVREKGIIEPLIVKREDNHFILAAGERRLRAAQFAGLHEVPAIIKELTNQELLEIGLIENLQRKDLNPIEEALAYDRLNKNFGLAHEQIAQLVSKDRSTVTNTLRLLGLPEKIKEYEKLRAQGAERKAVYFLSPGIGAQGGQAREAVQAGTDYPIVGRAIYESENPAAEVEKIYKECLEGFRKRR